MFELSIVPDFVVALAEVVWSTFVTVEPESESVTTFPRRRSYIEPLLPPTTYSVPIEIGYSVVFPFDVRAIFDCEEIVIEEIEPVTVDFELVATILETAPFVTVRTTLSPISSSRIVTLSPSLRTETSSSTVYSEEVSLFVVSSVVTTVIVIGSSSAMSSTTP